MAVKKSKAEAPAAEPKAKKAAPKKVVVKKAAAPKAVKSKAAAAPAADAAEAPKAKAPKKAATAATAVKADAPKVKAPAAKAPATVGKAGPIKLSESQTSLLQRVQAAGETGYMGGKQGENKTVDSLLVRKLIKKGSKDKTTGAFTYTLSKAGEKHLADQSGK